MTKLSAGDWVEVRSKDEILRTLDAKGRLDGLPFMPQMFRYCGKRFQVYKRAHKTCDTIAIKWDYPGRSLPDGIHLNLRCDGGDYGGCQAACLIFWKEQWLKPIDVSAGNVKPAPAANGTGDAVRTSGCTEDDVRAATKAPNLEPGAETVYVCQATRLLDYTKPLAWWDLRQYWQDYTSGNASLGRIARGTLYACVYYGTLAFSRRAGGPSRWVYDRIQALWGGLPFPRHRGKLPAGSLAPLESLNLQPGELVRVKPYAEILETIDVQNKNRGMTFDGEMVPYCGQTFRVRTRVEQFIDEKTGKMRRLKTPAVILDNVFCRSRYSYHRMYCPRSIFAWWREIWLERVPDNGEQKMVGDAVECPAMALMREAAEGRLVTPVLSARMRVEKESPVEPANVERKTA